jgi:hypothetical protein
LVHADIVSPRKVMSDQFLQSNLLYIVGDFLDV